MLQHEEQYLSNCRQKITRQATKTCAGCCTTGCTARDAAQNREEELVSTLSDLKLTRGIACPRVWQGCIKGEHIVATVHGGDITIGGERSAVDSLIQMISRTYEIKKQVIGEDADVEKSGRILNRVIEWSRDGTPCAVERNDEGGARRDESKGDNRCEQGQTQTKHEWDGMGDGDDRDPQQMAEDDANDSQALTGGDITRYRTFVARISYLSRSQVRATAGVLCDGKTISA